MKAKISQPAPSFSANAVMPDGEVREISLADYRGKYVLLFFYPMDFSGVCPAELVSWSGMAAQFEAENAQVLFCSTDTQCCHQAWRETATDAGGVGEVKYPMIADITKEIAAAYRVMHPMGVALRGLFLIDKEGVVRHMVVNDLFLRRSAKEALAMVQALKFYEEHGEVCPINWQK